MIDNERLAQWAKQAQLALLRHYDKDSDAGHLAAVVLILIADRDERERYIERVGERD